jgi:diaminopimelate decarboxylase
MQSIKIISKTKNQIKKDKEICNECGRNIGWCSGLFVDRIIDLDDYKARKEGGKPFPQGGYIYRECEKGLKE